MKFQGPPICNLPSVSAAFTAFHWIGTSVKKSAANKLFTVIRHLGSIRLRPSQSLALVFVGACVNVASAQVAYLDYTAFFPGAQAIVEGTPANGIDPVGVAVDGSGNIYMSLYQNDEVIKLTPPPLATTLRL